MDGDGEIGISDINYVIDAILSASHNEAYDVNEDGEVTVADINEVIQAILEKE